MLSAEKRGKKLSTVTDSEVPNSSNTETITIRRATYSELQALSSVLAAAFRDDVLFGQFIHPNRRQYPSDVAYYWHRRFQRDWWDHSHVFLAAVDTSVTPSRICGAAQWHRQGPTSYRNGWGLSKLDPRNLLYYLGAAQACVCAWVWPNRAVDPKREDVLERSEPFTEHVWRVPQREETWYLHFLGVDPEYQGRGVGRRLVAWGMDQAQKEGVSASVIAAYGKDPFYQACGFDTNVGRSGDGEGNPLASIPGGNIWFKLYIKER